MPMFTVNKLVACTPPKNRSVTTKKENGFAMFEQKTQLEELTVVFSASDFEKGCYLVPGQKVYIRGEDIKAAWATKEIDQGDQKFILVPLDRLVMVLEEGK